MLLSTPHVCDLCRFLILILNGWNTFHQPFFCDDTIPWFQLLPQPFFWQSHTSNRIRLVGHPCWSNVHVSCATNWAGLFIHLLMNSTCCTDPIFLWANDLVCWRTLASKHWHQGKSESETPFLLRAICSMYGISTNIYPINDPNVGKYTIHGAYGKAQSSSPVTPITAAARVF